MEIVDLTDTHLEAYLHCLEPYAEEIRDGVERKRAWVEQKRDRGLLVKLAIDDDGEPAGMIQSVPIEETGLVGEGLHFVLCIWVHSHSDGIGDRSGRGMGTSLLGALEAEAQLAGARGMAAWGMALPFWMRAGWFRRHGYRKADRRGIAQLVWKPFEDGLEPPRWPAETGSPELEEGKVTVTCYDGGWCTLQNANCVHAHKAADATGAAFHEIDTADPEAAKIWGQDYGIWIDDKQVFAGPPLSEDKVRRKIEMRQRGPWWAHLFGR